MKSLGVRFYFPYYLHEISRSLDVASFKINLFSFWFFSRRISFWIAVKMSAAREHNLLLISSFKILTKKWIKVLVPMFLHDVKLYLKSAFLMREKYGRTACRDVINRFNFAALYIHTQFSRVEWRRFDKQRFQYLSEYFSIVWDFCKYWRQRKKKRLSTKM